jgi:hypothetical protein
LVSSYGKEEKQTTRRRRRRSTRKPQQQQQHSNNKNITSIFTNIPVDVPPFVLLLPFVVVLDLDFFHDEEYDYQYNQYDNDEWPRNRTQPTLHAATTNKKQQ